MRNKSEDLNNILFAQLERLDDEELTGDALEHELNRSKGIAAIASQIIENNNLTLKAYIAATANGIDVKAPQLLLGDGVNDNA